MSNEYISKAFGYSEDSSEQSKESFAYVIKKLGLAGKTVSEPLAKYYEKYKLNLAENISDEDLFERVNFIKSFSEIFQVKVETFSEERLSLIGEFLKFYAKDDLSKVSKEEVYKLQAIEEGAGGLTHWSKLRNIYEFSRDLSFVTRAQLESFKEIVKSLGISKNKNDSKGELEKAELVLKALKFNEASLLEEDSGLKVKYLMDKLRINLRDDLRLEIKEKIAVMNKLGFERTNFEGVKAIIRFMENNDYRFDKVETIDDIEKIKEVIDKLEIRECEETDISILMNSLKYLDIKEKEGLFGNTQDIENIQKNVKEISGSGICGLSRGGLQEFDKVIQVFAKKGIKDIDRNSINKMKYFFKEIGGKIADIEQLRASNIFYALAEVKIDLVKSSEQEISKAINLIRVAGLDVNSITSSNIANAKLLLERLGGDSDKAKKIIKAFTNKVATLGGKEIEKLEELIKLVNIQDLRELDESKIEILKHVIKELNMDIGTSNYGDVVNIVKILKDELKIELVSTSWTGAITEAAKSMFMDKRKQITEEIIRIESKYKVLGYENIEKLASSSALEKIKKVSEKFRKEANEKEDLEKINNIFSKFTYRFKDLHIDEFNRYLDVLKILGINPYKTSDKELDNMRKVSESLEIRIGSLGREAAEIYKDLLKCLGIDIVNLDQEGLAGMEASFKNMGYSGISILRKDIVDKLKVFGICNFQTFKGNIEILGINSATISNYGVTKNYQKLIAAIDGKDGVDNIHMTIGRILEIINRKYISLKDDEVDSMLVSLNGITGYSGKKIEFYGKVISDCKIDFLSQIKRKAISKMVEVSKKIQEKTYCDNHASEEKCKDVSSDYYTNDEINQICALNNVEHEEL